MLKNCWVFYWHFKLVFGYHTSQLKENTEKLYKLTMIIIQLKKKKKENNYKMDVTRPNVSQS